MDTAFGRLTRSLGRIKALARSRMRDLCAQGLGFGIRDRLLGALNRSQECLKRRPGRVPALERVELGIDFIDLGVEPSQTFGMLAHGALELVAARREIRERPS